MSWMAIEGEELARLEQRIQRDTGCEPGQLTGRMKLPFYENGSLLRLEGKTGRMHAVEAGDEALIPLDGSSAQIYNANEAAGLRLNVNNVVAYAMFFCGLFEIHNGEVGSFLTRCGNLYLDTGFVPQDLIPKVEEARDGSMSYTILAYLDHTGGLFMHLLKVVPQGAVTLLAEKPLGEFVCL
jgi:hypothetical protein